MKNVKNIDNSKVFIIGIGGISMYGIAKILIHRGCKVFGSDLIESQITKKLEHMGATITYGHNADNINLDFDFVIYTGAINGDNCELKRAKKLNLITFERSEFLGILSKSYKHIIAVAGTHGKTTTLSMLSEIFVNAGYAPTIHIGGKSINLDDSTIIGNNDYLLIEACEFKNSFRFLYPEVSVITNIEAEHLDYYKNLNNLKSAFLNFANNSKVCISNEKIKTNNLKNLFKTYRLKNINFNRLGYDFDVFYKDDFLVHIRLNLLGYHNIFNALYAISVAHYYNISMQIIAFSLQKFCGVERRYEKIGYIENIPIIIDYAHHPTEIKNSISGLKNVYKNILIVFQPHTFSRTKIFFNDFVKVLKKCNNLIIFKTYSAREQKIIGGDSLDLANKLKCKHFDSIDLILKEISSRKKNFECVLILGAGDLANKLKDLNIHKK